MYSVRLLPSVARAYQQAEVVLAKKLARCFEQLGREPRHHPNIRTLAGALKGSLRYRIGDYRVVYRIDEAAKQVIVTHIAHRKDVYE